LIRMAGNCVILFLCAAVSQREIGCKKTFC
jgi:hypothetical protein